MQITVTVNIPDEIAQEGTPLVAKEKGIDISEMNEQQVFDAVAQAFADEIVDRVKETIKRDRMAQAAAEFDSPIEEGADNE